MQACMFLTSVSSSTSRQDQPAWKEMCFRSFWVTDCSQRNNMECSSTLARPKTMRVRKLSAKNSMRRFNRRDRYKVRSIEPMESHHPSSPCMIGDEGGAWIQRFQ